MLTGGSNNTGSVSILGYDNLFKAFNVGLGSAISVLIFLCVAIIAVIFIKGLRGFGADHGWRGGKTVSRPDSSRTAGWLIADVLVLCYALVPVLWVLSLSLKPTSSVKDGKFFPWPITLTTTGASSAATCSPRRWSIPSASGSSRQ